MEDKVKIFRSQDSSVLQNDINEYLRDKNMDAYFFEFQYSTVDSKNGIIYSCMVIDRSFEVNIDLNINGETLNC